MNITFSYLVTTFFTSYLATERGLSLNTIASYSDCMKLLVRHLCERFGVLFSGGMERKFRSVVM